MFDLVGRGKNGLSLFLSSVLPWNGTMCCSYWTLHNAELYIVLAFFYAFPIIFKILAFLSPAEGPSRHL